jgi:hypothetical protein
MCAIRHDHHCACVLGRDGDVRVDDIGVARRRDPMLPNDDA